MEKQKRKRFQDSILNFILEVLIAMGLGISPAEAAALLGSEVHHVR